MRHVLGRFKLGPALVELQLDGAGGERVDRRDGRAGHVRAEVEPVALVNLLGDEERELVEQLPAPAVEDELQEEGVGRAEQLHARRLVHPAALDADEAVLDEVRGDADAVPAAGGVRLPDRLERRGLLAVERSRAALLEPHAHGLGFVRRVLRQHAHTRRDEPRARREVFELAGLVREPEQIRVGGVGRVLARLDRQLVRDAVVDHLGAAAEPGQERRVAPRGVHDELRGEHVRAELEADLVVAAAGRPVREHLDAAVAHLGDHPGDDDVPADAGGVPVRTLVAGLELDALDARLGDGVVQRDGDVVGGAARPHPLLDGAEVGLVRLGDVGGEADDLDAVLGEPLGDGAGVEPAGRGERDGLALQVGDGGHGESSRGSTDTLRGSDRLTSPERERRASYPSLALRAG